MSKLVFPPLEPNGSMLLALAIIVSATVTLTVIGGPAAAGDLSAAIGALVRLVKAWKGART